MQQRSIGSLSVSLVGLGCNNFGRRLDASGAREVVSAALDAGINFFDTADVYGQGQSEEFLGQALSGRREQVVVATKFGAPGSSPEGIARGCAKWVRTAVEQSLKRLDTDYIDLYQIHFPDADVPVADTLGALHELVQAGKVREIGCSNFGSGLLREAAKAAAEAQETPFRSVQNRFSILHREPEAKVIPACQELAVGLIPYFPLASGLLTGKFRKGEALSEGTRLAAMPENERARFLGEGALEAVERLREYAAAHDRSMLELAISWLASCPTVVSVIAGAMRPDQVAANATAASWQLGALERSEIAALATGDDARE